MQGEELRQTLRDTINELLFYFNDFHDKLHLLKSKVEQVKESINGYREKESQPLTVVLPEDLLVDPENRED